jgi:hypothetical protein
LHRDHVFYMTASNSGIYVYLSLSGMLKVGLIDTADVAAGCNVHYLGSSMRILDASRGPVFIRIVSTEMACFESSSVQLFKLSSHLCLAVHVLPRSKVSFPCEVLRLRGAGVNPSVVVCI